MQKDKILKWLNQNHQQVIELYKNQYIAYNENGVIAHTENLKELLQKGRESGEDFLVYLVPSHHHSLQILPIRFRSIVCHEWLPNYSVILKHNDLEVNTTMLVDSGAEVSLISLKLGRDLGYSLADSESLLIAQTIGGKVEYVLRNIEMMINEHRLIVPTAWLQTPIDTEQLLLGREVVFDKFNIEFKQAEEKIIFTWRK